MAQGASWHRMPSIVFNSSLQVLDHSSAALGELSVFDVLSSYSAFPPTLSSYVGMPSYAVVCASHGGIGPEYVRQLAGRSDTIVFAIVPNPAESAHLNTLAASLKNVYIIAGDVTDYNTLEHSAQRVSEVTGGTLDYLIHDAAEVDVDTGSEGLDDQKKLDGELKSAVELNLLGPTRSITAFIRENLRC